MCTQVANQGCIEDFVKAARAKVAINSGMHGELLANRLQLISAGMDSVMAKSNRCIPPRKDSMVV